MHDTGIEDRLRAALRGEGDDLPLTITAAELERRLAARQRQRNSRRVSYLAAAVAIVAIGTIGAAANGWLRLPAVGTAPDQVNPIAATPGRTELLRVDPRPGVESQSMNVTTPFGWDGAGFERVDPFVIATLRCQGPGTVQLTIDREPTQTVECGTGGGESVIGFSATPPEIGIAVVVDGPVTFALLVEKPSLAEIPHESLDPSASPAAFSPVMQVSVSTLGKLGATVSLRTGCWRPYAMTDAITGEGDCAEPSLVPLCCETLDVPYGSDLTFTVPGGWSIERSEIGIAGKAWVDDRVAASRSITGWRSTGDQAMRFDAVLSRDGENFSTSFGVSIHGAVDVPTVAPPSTACGAPDLSVPTPPAVRLIVDGVPSVAGTTATTHWGTASHQVDADPMPRAAIEIPAGSTLALGIAGDVCATDWRIEYGPPVTGPWTSIDRVGSLVLVHRTPPDGPVNGHANRFDLATLPPGEWYIEASLGYADGDAAVGWHVIVK
jgi:hypothetical protein